MRDSVLIYTENIDIISELTDEQAGILLKAIMSYQVDQVEQNIDDPVARIAFKAIKKQVDRCNENYEEMKRKRSEAGKKGMEKRWSDNKSVAEDNTVITNDNTAITNDNTDKQDDNKDNLNVKDKVKDNVKVKDIKHKHGEYSHVLLTDNEYSALLQEFGAGVVAEAVRLVDEYCETSGKRYKNYNLVIRKWGIQQAQKGRSSPARSPGRMYDSQIFDFDEIERTMVNR